MKKLLLSVIAFALITTSCNKYKDDFKNLNARLDALAAQIQGVSTLVAGIQASQVTLAQITAAIGTATGPLATQLTALTATVNNINTVLATVAAGTQSNTAALATLTTLVTNNQTAALAAIAGIQTSLTNAIASINLNTNTQITAAITALDASILAAQNNINATTAAAITAAQIALNASITAAIGSINNNTDAQILALANQLTAATTLLNNAITAAQAAIIANDDANFNVLKAIVDALTINLAIANAQIQTLLSSNNVFIGDLTINDEATLTAAEALGAKVRVITGDVIINTTSLDAGQMIRLKAVTDGATLAGSPPPDRIFIGTISGTLTVSGPNAVDLGSLVNVSGNTGDVTLSGANHDLSALLAVSGNYSVSGSDVTDNALASVGGNMTLNYCAAYIYPNLTTISGSLTTTDGVCVTSVQFPVLSSVGAIDGNTPTWAWASLVNLGVGNLSTLNAGASSGVVGTIILGEPTYPGALAITAPWATTLTMTNATSAGDLTIAIGASVPGVNPVTVVDLSNLLFTLHTPTGNINITTDASTNSTVLLNSYSDVHDVTINGPTVQTLQSYHTGVLSSGSIQTLNLPVYRALTNPGTQFVLLTALQNLTIGDVRGNIVPGSFVNLTTLQTLVATSSVTTVLIDLTGITSLTSVSTAGLLNELILSGNSSLTSVTTAGQMDRITVNNCNALLGLNSLGHVIKAVGSTGSYVTVTNNQNLASMTTSTSYLKSLIITGNVNGAGTTGLTTINLASYIAGQNITSGVVTMTIHTNRLNATYTQSVFATNSAPIIANASLAGFKAYATNIMLSGAHAGSTIDFGFRANSFGLDNSAATLDADLAAFTGAGGLATASFVQRTGDADGAAGSRIGVVRELGYVQ